MSNFPSYDDYLAHYGVKGMKWGIRKSKKVTGESRVTGAARDSIARRTQMLKEQRAGGKDKVSRGIGIAVYLGRKNFDKGLERQIKELDDADKRWREGNATVSDKITAALDVPIAGLFIEARPKS